MHWVYVLKCANNIIYVGETKRLYRRLNEHCNKDSGSEIPIPVKPLFLTINIYSLSQVGIKKHTHKSNLIQNMAKATQPSTSNKYAFLRGSKTFTVASAQCRDARQTRIQCLGTFTLEYILVLLLLEQLEQKQFNLIF